MILLRLPTPPSVNALYFNRWQKGKRGRGKTNQYRNWLKEADRWLLWQKKSIGQVRGKLELQIKFPKTRKDTTNMLKAVEDYLVSREITGDDKYNWSVSAKVDETLTCCEVVVIPQSGS